MSAGEFGLVFPAELVDAIAHRVVELFQETTARAAGEPEPWISADEAAAYLGKPKSRLYELAAADAVRHGRDGRSVLFRRSDLDVYLTAHRDGGT
jgi:excisionase family DNA binding protein